MESRAAVFREVGAPVSIERIALDSPGPTEVLVPIAAVGLCRNAVTEIKIPPLELFVSQKAIMGAVYGFVSPRLQIPERLGLCRKGAIKLRELITQTCRLDGINQGYADLDAGKNLRGVVVFDG
jgi:Zn-dependent alcohol dehydrogenase